MRNILWGLCMALCLFLTGCKERSEMELYMTEGIVREETAQEETIPDAEPAAETSEDRSLPVIYVHVCGAVEYPGVYELEDNSRGYEAVELAGGFSEDADQSSVNLAQKLSDGQRLYIPTVEETELLREQEEAAAAGLVNINSAGLEKLMELPGIGQTRGQRIIDYRTAHGEFKSPEELMQVEGIKESVYEKLKDLITIE